MGHGWGQHTDSAGWWGAGRGGPGLGGFGGRGRPGPPPWLADLFGMGTPPPRAPRARRGDVRAAILSVLAEADAASDSGDSTQEINGYGVIQAITDRSDGAWRPSPGSVYPTISQLEDEGLVITEESRGRRVLRLTEAGRAYAQDNQRELTAVWDGFGAEAGASTRSSGSGGSVDYAQLKPEIGKLMSAVWQIATQGTDRQRAEAISLLVETRRRLYGLLAADHDEPDEPDGPEEDRDA